MAVAEDWEGEAGGWAGVAPETGEEAERAVGAWAAEARGWAVGVTGTAGEGGSRQTPGRVEWGGRVMGGWAAMEMAEAGAEARGRVEVGRVSGVAARERAAAAAKGRVAAVARGCSRDGH